MSDTLLMRDLSYSFGPIEVFSEVNIAIQRQQVVALVGPSGCGKTTLLRLCASLLDIIDGTIANPFTKQAFMFQQPNLLPWKNSLDNIALGLKARGLDKAERQVRSQAISLSLGLQKEDWDKFPHELSGGMQQRVALARALVLKPDLLLLDEPFSALDIGLKLEMYELLLAHVSQQNATVLMITHDLMEAVRLSDKIYVMRTDPGGIVEQILLDTAIPQRDDTWVYETTAQLMKHPAVQESFGLTGAFRGREYS